jgi:hypothetical protein
VMVVAVVVVAVVDVAVDIDEFVNYVDDDDVCVFAVARNIADDAMIMMMA